MVDRTGILPVRSFSIRFGDEHPCKIVKKIQLNILFPGIYSFPKIVLSIKEEDKKHVNCTVKLSQLKLQYLLNSIESVRPHLLNTWLNLFDVSGKFSLEGITYLICAVVSLLLHSAHHRKSKNAMDCRNIQQNDMESCVLAIEGILNYTFRNRKLLEDALTHPSFSTVSSSYGRLEFLGDAALGLAFANFLYLAYPALDEGSLTLLRSVNVCNEKLARIAVRHHFYRFIRHNLTDLGDKVNEFTLAVMEEDDVTMFGGVVKAPKVLADIVESIAAAVYIDCGFDLKAFWMVFRGLLEPIVTWEILQEQPQPVTKLFQLCQKQRKQIHIKQWREDLVYFASVYVDDKLVASASSAQKDISKLNSAREALSILAQMNMSDDEGTSFTSDVGENNEIIAAKQKLFEICGSKKWPKPSYRVEKEEGASHDKRYTCCVEVEVEEAVLLMHGSERSRVKDAENSAASYMIYSLLESGRVQR